MKVIDRQFGVVIESVPKDHFKVKVMSGEKVIYQKTIHKISMSTEMEFLCTLLEGGLL